MAATFKPKFMALLLVCSMLLLAQVSESKISRPCPRDCRLHEGYMTCPSSGDKRRPAHCNCCVSGATKGCILHAPDGTPVIHC